MDWLRWYRGTSADPKWGMISKRAGVSKVAVIALWAALLEHALEQEPRGRVDNFDPELADCMLDLEEGSSAAIIQALTDKGMIKDGVIAAWDKRQYESERSGSAERMRRYRERLREKSTTVTEKLEDEIARCGNVTPALRNVTPPDTDTETDTESDTETDTESDTETDIETLSSTKASTKVKLETSLPPDGGAPHSESLSLSPQSKQPRDNCPHEAIIALYHKVLPMEPHVRVWSGVNEANLRARWREDKARQNLDWWQRFFQYVARSDFLTGRTYGSSGKPFFASLGWIVKAANFEKILNGNYENRDGGVKAMTSEEIAQEFERIDRLWGFKPKYDAEAEAEYTQEAIVQ